MQFEEACIVLGGVEECIATTPACQSPRIKSELEIELQMAKEETHKIFLENVSPEEAARAGSSWDSCNEI